MHCLASTIGRGVRAVARVLVILAAAGPWEGVRAQAPAVEAVDDIFTISHDAVAIKQSLAQTAPNVQSNAIWGGTGFLGTLDEKLRSARAVVGGSSAGMHVLGGLSYLNEPNPTARPNQAEGLGGLSSVRAIGDPAGLPITLRDGFVTSGWARDLRVLTDTHFGQRQTGAEVPANLRGRMGRLVGFLARLKAGQPDATFRGLAADEATAVLVEATGELKDQGTVVGKGSAYLLTTPEQPPRLPPPGGTGSNGRPATLAFGPLQVYKLDGREAVEPAVLNFDFAAWRSVVGGVPYRIAAEGGSLTNLTDPARDVYNNPKR